MTELKDRLQVLELIQAPDLRDRIKGWEPRAPRSQPLFKRLGVVLVAFVVAGAGIAFAVQAFRAADPRTQPAATVENGSIAFSVGPDADIFVVGPDGTGLTRMVDRHVSGQEGGLQMAWSPDGTKLAFTDYRLNGSTGLFVMDAEGGEPVDISPSLQLADSPTWSPDGSELAFGGCCDDYYDIYVVNADGTDLRRLTKERDNGVDGAHMPAWSPDGSRIAYSVDRYNESSQDETHGISIVNVDGSDPVFITWSSNSDETPVWSPDGTKIAFMRKAPDGYVDLFVVSVVGELTEPMRLSSPSVHATSLPNWAADSQEVLFSARRLDNDNQGIYVVSVDGTGERVLLEDAFADDPVWSPDGRWIAFVRDDAGSGLVAIWLMQTDGTGPTELASGLKEAGGIDWQPLYVPDDETDIPQPSATSTSSFPLTYLEGENEVMPIAFLNGTTAEIVYPADLPLEQVTIQPNGSLYVGVLDFRLDGLTSNFVVQRSSAEGLEPIQSYDPPKEGIVRRWQAVPAAGQAVRLGPWLVDVPYETLTDEQRQAFLDHLFGLETEGGFLILEATPPLRLWQIGEGEELVAQMYFDVDDLQILDRCIDFSQAADDSFVRNGMEVFRAVEGAAVGVDVLFWCDPTGEFGVQVNEGSLADALIDGLSFRNVQR